MNRYAYASIRLPQSGYQQVNLQLLEKDKQACKKWIKSFPSVYFEPIFKDHIKPIGKIEPEQVPDRYRLQVIGEVFLEDIEHFQWWKNINTQLQTQLDFIFDGLHVVYWTILWSKKGGSEQSMHTDFTIHDTYVRLSGIIALERGTKLIIDTSLTRQKDRKEENKTVIHLNVGDAVIFRGDKMHAGAKYTSDNRRLFFKAIPIGNKLLKGEYDTVGYCFVCENDKTGGCRKRFPTDTLLKNHRSYCVAVHGEELVNNRRQKARNNTTSYKKRKQEEHERNNRTFENNENVGATSICQTVIESITPNERDDIESIAPTERDTWI